jgi:hypothetical protein
VEQVRSAGIDIQTPTLGSRRAPDGTLLAQSAAVDQLGVTPFFIEWSTDTPHPSTTSPVGLHAGHDGARASSARTLAATFQNCRISTIIPKSERSGMKVTLDCPHGRVEFRS